MPPPPCHTHKTHFSRRYSAAFLVVPAALDRFRAVWVRRLRLGHSLGFKAVSDRSPLQEKLNILWLCCDVFEAVLTKDDLKYVAMCFMHPLLASGGRIFSPLWGTQNSALKAPHSDTRWRIAASPSPPHTRYDCLSRHFWCLPSSLICFCYIFVAHFSANPEA